MLRAIKNSYKKQLNTACHFTTNKQHTSLSFEVPFLQNSSAPPLWHTMMFGKIMQVKGQLRA